MSGYLADCHLHSRISPDARDSMADMAKAALAAGMDEICFTDHADFADDWGGWIKTRTRFRWAELLREFGEAKAEIGLRPLLRLGVELGDTFCDPDGAEAFMNDAPPLDFIIGSIHVLSEKMGYADLSAFLPRDEQHAREAMSDYLTLVRDLAEHGTYSVLGHLTLPLRYLNERRGYSLTYDGYEDEIADILRLVIERGRGIEVNANRGHTPLPDEKWLKLYRDLGGEIVTLGTDSHSVRGVGDHIRECRELLKACGFPAFCTFHRMEPVFHGI